MKKLLFILGAFAASVSLAEDSYLYWMVNTDAAAGFTYDAIQVRATKSGETDSILTIGWNNAGSFETLTLSGLESGDIAGIKSLEGSGTGFYASLANLSGGSSGWSYMVELLSGSTTVAQSDTLSSDLAAASIATTSGGTGLQDLVKAWNPGGYHAVPEPNSALLMVFGLSALALRRRKQLKA